MWKVPDSDQRSWKSTATSQKHKWSIELYKGFIHHNHKITFTNCAQSRKRKGTQIQSTVIGPLWHSLKQFFGYKHTIDLSDRVSTQGQWSSECDCHSALWTFALKGNTINPHLCAETERRPVKIARHRQRLDEIGASRGYTRITAGLRASHCLNPQLLTGPSLRNEAAGRHDCFCSARVPKAATAWTFPRESCQFRPADSYATSEANLQLH